MIVPSPANLRFEGLFPLIEILRLIQSKLRNKSFKVAVNNVGELKVVDAGLRQVSEAPTATGNQRIKNS